MPTLDKDVIHQEIVYVGTCDARVDKYLVDYDWYRVWTIEHHWYGDDAPVYIGYTYFNVNWLY